MDGVWESRENSLTEPQRDKRGRSDKDVCEGGQAFFTEPYLLTKPYYFMFYMYLFVQFEMSHCEN